MKSQIWYMDFILGVTIFTLALVISFKYISTDHYIENQNPNMVLTEATRLSETLLTPGIPQNWTGDDVVMIGIASHGVLNVTKIDRLKNLSIVDYDNVRYIFGLKSDFIIFFENRTNEINLTNQTYLGKPGYTKQDVETLNPDNVITINRYAVYKRVDKSEILTMKVVVWQD